MDSMDALARSGASVSRVRRLSSVIQKTNVPSLLEVNSKMYENEY